MEKVNVIIYVDNIRFVNNTAIIETLKSLNGHCQITVIDDNCPEKDSLIIKDFIPNNNISIRYVSNSKFMGFSESCNSAKNSYNDDNDVLLMTGGYLLNIDNLLEMIKILNSSEHIGAVVPRSNSGVFSRYPYINKLDIQSENIDKSLACYKNTNKYLNDYNTVPYPDNTIILYKKLLLDNWGELCSNINSPSVAIRSLCEDLNRPGFSTVLANHAFVPSYSEYMNPYDEKEEWVLDECYGYLDKVADAYEDMSGFYNNFTRVLDPEFYSKKRILLAIMDVPQDLSRLNCIDHMIEELEDCEVTILTTEETDRMLSFSDRYSNVMYYNNIEGEFHAGIIIMETFFPEIFYIACKICLKLAVVYYDKAIINYKIQTLDQALNFRMQKSIFQSVDMVIFENKLIQNELEMIFGNNKRVNNIRKLIDRQDSDWLTASVKEILNVPLDKLRIQQINVVQKYIWSAMSGFNNLRTEYGVMYNTIATINSIITSTADNAAKLEAISNLQMEK